MKRDERKKCRQMVYQGPNLALRGKTALVKAAKGQLFAQFDDLSLPKTFTHGWMAYPYNSFLPVNS